MPDGQDITVNTPEGDKLHFPLGTDTQTITAAMGKLKMQKMASANPEQQTISQLPNPAGQAKQQLMAGQPGLTRGTGRYPIGVDVSRDRDAAQTTSTLSGVMGVPDASFATPSQAKTGIGGGVLAASGMVAPAATALGLAGGIAGQQAFQTGASMVGASPAKAELWGDTGGIIGGLAGGEAGSRLDAPLIKWITSSKTGGAALLQQASAKAGNAPVELSPQTNEIVDKLVQHGKLGGKIPKVISDLLERVGPSTKQAAEATPGPLTYDEARILQSNISSLSAEEQMALKGSQKGLLKQLAASFSHDVQTAATNAGVGVEHAQGMSEYAVASARDRALAKAGKAVAAGAGVGGAAYMTEKLIRKAAEAVKP